MAEHKVIIGASGWSFDWESHIDNSIPKDELKLTSFSRFFDGTEVNYTFYHLPKVNTIEKWKEQTRDGFEFALKLSRQITHYDRLRTENERISNFLSRYTHLEEKAGPILIQLPPSLERDHVLIEKFLHQFDNLRTSEELDYIPLAFEFRHPSWFEDTGEVEEALSEYNAAWVFAHSSKHPYPDGEPLTSDQFVYFRMHGPEEMFSSPYGKKELKKWKKKIDEYAEDRDVYVFFNNTDQGDAADDVMILKELLEG